MAFSLARRSSAGSMARGAAVAYTSRMPASPRVAYFPDSFHEINGVGTPDEVFERIRNALTGISSREG